VKAIALVACLLAGVPSLAHAEPVNLLEEDWSTATHKAQSSGKFLYVAFIGEGWSVSSNRFKEAVLDSAEFQAFADDKLVYCSAYARRVPKLDKAETARLQSLVIHFDIKSYPTILLIAPDGTEILRHGFREDSASAYVSLLTALLPAK
jgi:hypothetical protein